MSFGILYSTGFAFVALAVLLTLVMARQYVRKSAALTRMGFPELLLRKRSLALFCCLTIVLGITLVRPYFGKESVELPGSARDRILMVDVSLSMLANDVSPSRLELAKRKIKDLVSLLSQGRSPERLGIVLFAGDAYLFCPLTEDLGVVKLFADSISPDLISAPGSNLARALTVTLEAFENSKSRNARALLLSDGEDNQFALEESKKLLEKSGIPVDVIGLGTAEGSPIRIRGRFVRDDQSQTVVSKLNDTSLREVAQASGAVYVPATLGDGDIQTVLNARSELSPVTDDSRHEVTVYGEVGPILIGIALVTLLLLIARDPRVIATIAFLLTCDATAETPTPKPPPMSLREAYDLYNSGDYAGAADGYRAAYERDKLDLRALQGLGSALFKARRYDEAAKAFTELKQTAANARESYAASYDLGNALLASSRCKEAVQAFDDALRFKPDDAKARHNKEIAEKSCVTPTPSPTPSANPSAEPSPSPSSSASPGASPSPQGSPQPSGSPQSGTPSPKSSPNGAPTPDSAGTETPSDKPSPAPEASPLPQPAAPRQTADTKPLSQNEAEMWLESLPDSPLLLQRKSGDYRPPGGQTW